MSVEIFIDAKHKEAVKELQKYPDKLAKAIMDAFTKETHEAVRHITIKRLRGSGPFPVSLHKLGHVTGQWSRSLTWEGPFRKGNEVRVLIGAMKATADALSYGAAHEFGFKGNVRVPATDVDEHRRRLRKPTGRRKYAKVRAHKRKAHTKKVNIPARAPISFGIQDRTQDFARAIGQAIQSAWKELKDK